MPLSLVYKHLQDFKLCRWLLKMPACPGRLNGRVSSKSASCGSDFKKSSHFANQDVFSVCWSSRASTKGRTCAFEGTNPSVAWLRSDFFYWSQDSTSFLFHVDVPSKLSNWAHRAVYKEHLNSITACLAFLFH